MLLCRKLEMQFTLVSKLYQMIVLFSVTLKSLIISYTTLRGNMLKYR